MANIYVNGSVHSVEFIEDVNVVNHSYEPLTINIYGHIHTFILVAVNSAVLW